MSVQGPVLLDNGWSMLLEGVAKIKRVLEKEDDYGSPFQAREYMDLYSTIYNMCTQKPPHDYSPQLYERYRDVFVQYIEQKVNPELSKHSGDALLSELKTRWSNHKVLARWLIRFFQYLDRYYVVRFTRPTLSTVGMEVFRDNVYVGISERTTAALLNLIERERNGEMIDRSLAKSVLGIYVDVGMGNMNFYEDDFEAALLQDTATFYRAKAAAWVQSDSMPAYLVEAEAALTAEEERIDAYLHRSSAAKVLREAERELVLTQAATLLEKENSGVGALLRDGKTEDLARLFRLFNRVADGLAPVATAFREHIKAEGLELVAAVTASAAAAKEKKKEQREAGVRPSGESQSSAFEQYVRDVIALHVKYRGYVAECFSDASLFFTAMKDAFGSFCNQKVAGSMPAELMAEYCDSVLKKGGKEKRDEAAKEDTLDKVVSLLDYITEKDLFAEFYRKKLSRRLLGNTSESDEHERAVLARLKAHQGAQYTSKMEGMVQDLTLAREKQPAFKEWLSKGDRKLALTSFTVTVLTTGNWPSYPPQNTALPPDMAAAMAAFQDFYTETNEGRRLAWFLGQGTAQLDVTVDSGRKFEVTGTTGQIVLLNLFKDAETLTVGEIMEKMNLPLDEVARLTHSLYRRSPKLLVVKGGAAAASKAEAANSESLALSFNGKFTSKSLRVKLCSLAVDERKKVHEDVHKDRKNEIDAAIVRTMKSRKALAHRQLVFEVMQQLTSRFNPDSKDVKKRIENLIDREFLKRDDDNQDLFHYLA